MGKSKKQTKKEKVFRIMSSMVKEGDGVLMRKSAREKGIHQEYIRLFKEENDMEELMPGVYSDKNMFTDELHILQKRYTRGIYSHETALSLWDMTDIIPMEYLMTFPRGYNNPNLKSLGVKIKFTPEEHYEIGKTTIKTTFGNDVIVYDRERTLCDLFHTRHKADKSVVLDAIKRYTQSDDTDYQKLMRYAKLFKVDDKIRPYLEVLI